MKAASILLERGHQATTTLRSFAFDRLSALAAVVDGTGTIVDTNEAWRLFSQLNDGSSGAKGLGTNYVEVCERAASAGSTDAGSVYGHATGDSLLVKVASRIKRAVRDVDIMCRFGGDEFVLVCPSLETTDAQLLATRLRELMVEPFQFDATQLVTGVSVGVATSGAESTMDSLLRAADAAMYVDKARRQKDPHPRRTRRMRPQVRPMPTPTPATSDGEVNVLAELHTSTSPGEES
jgi:predicted signal transduction protein with EAL and GGDEF domain